MSPRISTTVSSQRSSKRARTLLAPLAGASLLTLTACSGGVASGNAGQGGGEGFDYGASQSEVDAILEDLEPITLKFQPSAASENTAMAAGGVALAELIEERSGGKITVDVTWGQAIAGYDAVHDALEDGRLDLAYTLPIYDPAEFKAFNDLSTTTALLPSSPFVGEMLPLAVYNDLGWTNDELLASFTDRGLTPLTPFLSSATYYTACTEPAETLESWHGNQTRIASTAQDVMIRDIGATPVSMEYTETYEALQRGTVDCNLGPTAATVESGVLEVAPHVGYMTESSFPRVGAAYLAGSSFETLPLAYQQIIFDSNALALGEIVRSYTDAGEALISEAKAQGGEVAQFDTAMEDRVGEVSQELTAAAVENGMLPDDIADQVTESVSAWSDRLEELGYADAGETEEFDEWYDSDTDFAPFAQELYETGAAMEHRPS
jgi:TRAP-type C4-dicarboxylate transport system substrate-binding protein